jgi:hypothetical protein
MKILSVIAIILILIPISSSLTVYNITLIDQKIFVNVTFTLKSDQDYDVWRISWEIPQDYEIISVSDELGSISFAAYPGYIYFETHRLRTNERRINVQYFLKDAISTEYEPLKKVHLQLSGFSNEKTIVNVYLPRLISGDASYNFTEYFQDNFAQFVGYGPVDIILFYSYSGREYDNYILFGPADLTVADEMFSLVTNITGMPKPYNRLPVVVLSDVDFEKQVQPWGSASHTRGGLILIKKSVANSPYNASTILHETTHAINAKVLKWNQVEATWFEEGTATFIESLANQVLGLKQGELFGENKVIKQGSEKIVIKSRGNKEMLWDYYQQGKDFMYYWNLSDDATRDFGYAFSELVIRYSVHKNGIGKIREAYMELSRISEPVRDPVESTNIILSALDTNFMPCYSVDRKKFDQCLKEINEQQLVIPMNAAVAGKKEIVNETVEVRPINESQISSVEASKSTGKNIFVELLQLIKNFLKIVFQPVD